MPASLTSFGGYDWTTDWDAGVGFEDGFGGWGNDVQSRPRPGSDAALFGVASRPREITAYFTAKPGVNFRTALPALLAGLDPENPEPRALVGVLWDGTTAATRPAVIRDPHLMSPSGGYNAFRCTFVSTVAPWRHVTPASYGPTTAARNRLATLNPTFLTNITGWEEQSVTAGITYSSSWDGTTFYDAAGALFLSITANVAGVGATLAWRNTAFLPVVVGSEYTVVAANRTNNANITPRLGVRWLDAAQAPLSTDTEADWTPTASTWSVRSFTATAPANAAFARVLVQAICDTAGPTGNIRFDAVEFYAADAGTWTAVQADNGGDAPAWPVITLTPGTQEHAGDFKYLRELTITNDQTTPVRNWPRLIRLGDTTAWVAETGGAASDGANVATFVDGVELRRELVAFNTARSFAWIVIPYLGPGETMTVQILYGGTYVASALRAEEIAIDTDYVTRTIVAAGSTTTVVNISSGVTPTGRYDRGRFVIMDGAQAGTTRSIDTITGAAVTLSAALSSVPANGTAVLIQMSDNFQHAWPIIQNDRKTDRTRGLWFADDADDVPGDISFAPAGAWAPSTLLTNKDVYAQYEYTRVDVDTGGGVDNDTFTILNAYRAGEGGELVKDVGMADGVSYTAPIDIDGWRFNYAFWNPNGVATAFFGSRTDGGRDFRTVLEDSADSSSLAVASTTSASLPEGTRHLTANLLPRNGESIGPSWRADSGTRTGGTSSTLGDASKSWTVDQFAGAVLRIVQGTGAGKKYDVDSNTDDVLTITGTFSPALDNTSRYEVRNPPLVANLRNHDVWLCEYADPFTQSEAGSSVAAYPATVRFRLDVGASPGTDYRTARVGFGRRLVFLKATERLVVDCPTGRARVELVSGGAFVRDATDALEFIHARADEDGGDVADPERLRLTPGDHDVYVENDVVGGWNVTIAVAEGSYE